MAPSRYVANVANELQWLMSSRAASVTRIFCPARCTSRTSQVAPLGALTQQRQTSSSSPCSHSLLQCFPSLFPSPLCLPWNSRALELEPCNLASFLAAPLSIAPLADRHQEANQGGEDRSNSMPLSCTVPREESGLFVLVQTLGVRGTISICV